MVAAARPLPRPPRPSRRDLGHRGGSVCRSYRRRRASDRASPASALSLERASFPESRVRYLDPWRGGCPALGGVRAQAARSSQASVRDLALAFRALAILEAVAAPSARRACLLARTERSRGRPPRARTSRL